MSGSSGDSQLFEETFVITEVDHKKYDRVARLTAESTDKQTKMTLDINTELYPCSEKETLTVVLATTLALDGQANDVDGKGWRDVSKAGAPGSGESTLADMYDYVCYGKIYKFEDGPDGQTVCVQATPETTRERQALTTPQQGVHFVRRSSAVISRPFQEADAASRRLHLPPCQEVGA